MAWSFQNVNIMKGEKKKGKETILQLKKKLNRHDN